MNAILKIFFLCPVPEDQKPINEYIVLKENELLNWLPFLKQTWRKQFIFLFGSLSFIFFFLSWKNPNASVAFFLEVLLKMYSFLLNFGLLGLLGILLSWNQLRNHFNKSRLFYEEGSWYDGQFWEKPFSIIKNDRFLSTQQINPIPQLLKKYILVFFWFNFLFLLT